MEGKDLKEFNKNLDLLKFGLLLTSGLPNRVTSACEDSGMVHLLVNEDQYISLDKDSFIGQLKEAKIIEGES